MLCVCVPRYRVIIWKCTERIKIGIKFFLLLSKKTKNQLAPTVLQVSQEENNQKKRFSANDVKLKCVTSQSSSLSRFMLCSTEVKNFRS